MSDVDICKYKYESLIKDIMKLFLPRVAKVSKFKIERDVIGGDIFVVYDNESMCRCLLYGESEMDIDVDVQQASHVGGSGVYNPNMGYYAEKVNDDVEVIDLVSDGSKEEGDGYDGVDVSDSKEGVKNCSVEFDDSDQNESEDDDCSSNCVLSADEEDIDFNDGEAANIEDETTMESEESLDEEEEHRDGSEDRLSGVESDEEVVERVIDDYDLEREMEQLERVDARTCFKRKVKFDRIYL